MARPRLASLCRSMLALALLWGPARAETPAEAMIEPLIVTARLRAENDLAAPVSLSVITAGTLRALGTDTVSGLAARLPAMGYSSPNPRNTALMIRGLGSGVAAISQANDGLEPGVGFYVDGVYRARPAAAAFDLPDLERVEVLRGPQGTLFGKNTTAGVVSLITRAPAAAPEADAEATVGEFGYRRLKASATGPLGDERLTARLSFGGAQRDGMLRNINSGERSNSLGAFNLSARLRILQQMLRAFRRIAALRFPFGSEPPCARSPASFPPWPPPPATRPCRWMPGRGSPTSTRPWESIRPKGGSRGGSRSGSANST